MRLDYFTIKRKPKNPKRTRKALRKLEIYKKPTFTYDLQSVMKGKKCWHFPVCKRFSHMGECKLSDIPRSCNSQVIDEDNK